MKKLSLLLLLLVQVVAYGQSFHFYPSVGIRDARDSSKGFIVFNFSGMTADEIKAAVVAKLPTIYDYASGRIQYIDGNGISLIASTGRDVLFYNKTWSYNDWYYEGVGGDFSMNIYFKDGKIRYDSPIFQRLYIIKGNDKRYYKDYGNMMQPIYELIKGESQQDPTVDYFNKLVRALNNAVREAASKSADW